MVRRSIFRHLLSWATFLEAIILIPLCSIMTVHADPKFRSFTDDRHRLEYYVDQGKDAAGASEWRTLILGGKEALEAEWERDAESEISREIRDRGNDETLRPGLEKQRDEALAEWESLADEAIAGEEGKWYASRVNIIYGDFDRDTITAALEEAKESASSEEWNMKVRSAVENVSDAWDEQLEAQLEKARGEGASLDQKVRDSYLAEIERIQNELANRFDLERNTLVYRAYNQFITDLMIDTESLRVQSEAEGGSAIADRIIAETESSLKSEEEAVLREPDGAEPGAGGLDLEGLGKDWEARLRTLVETGMNTWQSALDRLYDDMEAWQKNAGEALDTGNKAWREAYDALFYAKEAWQQKITGEVNEAIVKWQDREESLKENLDRSQQDFTTYTNTLNDQWFSHSAGLSDMNRTGSRIYGESINNIQWLNSMIERYRGKGAFDNNSQGLQDVVNGETGNRINNAIAGANIQPYRLDMLGNIMTDAWGNPMIYQWAAVTGTLIGTEFSEAGDALTERYQITVTKWQRDYGLLGASDSSQTIDSFVWTNVMNDDSKAERKSAYFIYSRELTQWNTMQETMRGIIGDTETTMHDGDMLGTGGPGYLTFSGTTGDPYLMTEAEQALSLAEKEREYWTRRLAIAEAVKQYATASKRESAETTIQSTQVAENSLSVAKTTYTETLKEVSDCVEKLSIIQGRKPSTPEDPGWDEYYNSIAYLSDMLESKEQKLKEEENNYQALQRAIILLENNQGISFVENEMREIEKNLVRIDRDLGQKCCEYYRKTREAEEAGLAAGFAETYGQIIIARENAKASMLAYTAIVSGDETEANLLSWIGQLDSVKETVWGDTASSRFGEIISAKNVWEGSTGDAKTAAWNSLCALLRSEYSSLTSNFTITNRLYQAMRDRDLDVKQYNDNRSCLDIEIYGKSAELSRDAFELIDDVMDALDFSGQKSYDSLITALSGELAKYRYRYGGDNHDYAVRYAAMRWAEANMTGIAPETWSAAMKKVSGEEDAADGIAALYGDYTGFDAAAVKSFADMGIEQARAVLFEYYNPGSKISMASYLAETGCNINTANQVQHTVASFVTDHSTYWSGQDIATADFTTALKDYLSSGGGDFSISREIIPQMNEQQLSYFSGLLQRYIDETDAAVPQGIRDLAGTITETCNRMKLYRFISDNRDLAGAAVLRDAAEHEASVAKSAYNFTTQVNTLLTQQGAGYKTVRSIFTSFNALNVEVRTFLEGQDDEASIAVREALESFASLQREIEYRSLAGEFISDTNTLAMDQFIETKCAAMTAAEKVEFTSFLLPYAEKRRLLTTDTVPSIMEYIEGRALTGNVLDDVTGFALNLIYCRIIESGDYSDVDPAFRDYARYREFEEAMGAVARLDGESDDDYVTRILDSYMTSHSGEDRGVLETFARGYIAGTISSRAFLPEKVQYVLAGGKFMEEMFHRGEDLLAAGAIDLYVDSSFADFGLNDTVKGLLKGYISGMLQTYRYYGQELASYLAGLDDTERTVVRRYLYLTDEAGDNPSLLAGFNQGIYGLTETLESDIALRKAMAGELGSAMRASSDNYAKALGRVKKDRDTMAAQYSALVSFQQNPGQYASYRDDIIEVTDEAGNIVIASEAMTGSTTDRRNAETGEIEVYAKGDAGPDGSGLAGLIIEEENALRGAFTRLFDAGDAMIADSRGTLYGVFASIDALYNPEAAYSPVDGKYSFEAAMNSIASETQSLSLLLGSERSALASSIESLEASESQAKSDLVSRGATREKLDDSGVAELRKELDGAAISRRKMEGEYQEALGKVRERQEQYSGAMSEYMAAVETASASYATLQERDFTYEKAYAVWEYASTPYLGTQSYTGTEESGTSGAPDAMDRYTTVKAQYDAAIKDHAAKEAAVKAQETVDALHADGGYMAARSDFEEATRAYARAIQTETLLKEDLEALRQELTTAESAYAYQKAQTNSGLFVTKSMTAEMELERDRVLSTMLEKGSAGIDEYVSYAGDYFMSLNPTMSSFASEVPLEIRQTYDLLYKNFNPELVNNIGSAQWGVLCAVWANNYQAFVMNVVQCNGYESQLRTMLNDVLAAKNTLTEKDSRVKELEQVRSVADLGQVLRRGDYQCSTDDTAQLYDDTAGPVSGGINIAALRRETARTDLDGHALKALVEGGKAYIIDINGKKTGESYSISDASILLKDAEGNSVAAGSLAEGVQYLFYDRTYRASEIIGVLSDTEGERRNLARDDYLAYADDATTRGSHDRTVVLRDAESTYWNLLEYARDLGNDKGEVRQRSFEAYETILSELLYDGNGGSIDDKIVETLIAQNSAQQELLWAQQQRQFEETRGTWIDTVNYIVNRGGADWADRLTDIETRWRKWDIETRSQISDGQKTWEREITGYTDRMKAWREESARASSEAASRKIAEELEETIQSYTRDMKGRLPAGISFTVDTQGILSEAMKNLPADSIGMLARSMEAVSTAGGFTSLLNLNLSGGLQARFEKEMKSYETSLSVMKNLRVMDVLNAIVDSFNQQLEDQNKSALSDVAAKIRPSYGAPFMRNDAMRAWMLRIVSDKRMSGTRHEVIVFPDYQDYRTDTVKLTALKGLSGQRIDFNNPATYMNLQASELDAYVSLETDQLNKAIDRVFNASSGSFTRHVQTQYTVLSQFFRKSDERYWQGQAIASRPWYESSDFALIEAIQNVVMPLPILKTIMKTVRGINEGGFLGGITGIASGLVSEALQVSTAGQTDFDLSYSSRDGFSTSFHSEVNYYGARAGFDIGYSERGGFGISSFGGYGNSNAGAEGRWGWDRESGFTTSGGVRVGRYNNGNGASVFIGGSYAQHDRYGRDNVFGLEVKAEVKSGAFKMEAHAGYSVEFDFKRFGDGMANAGFNVSIGKFDDKQNGGAFTLGMDWNQGGLNRGVTLHAGFDAKKDNGGFSLGFDYNVTQRAIAGVSMDVSHGYTAGGDAIDPNSGFSGRAGFAFNYVRGRGYDVGGYNTITTKNPQNVGGDRKAILGMTGRSTLSFNERGMVIRGASAIQTIMQMDESDAATLEDRGEPRELAERGFWERLGDGITGALNDFGTWAGNGISRIGNWMQYGNFECAADLGMTDKEYSEWVTQREYYQAQGIEVGYTKEQIDVESDHDEVYYANLRQQQENTIESILERYNVVEGRRSSDNNIIANLYSPFGARKGYISKYESGNYKDTKKIDSIYERLRYSIGGALTIAYYPIMGGFINFDSISNINDRDESGIAISFTTLKSKQDVPLAINFRLFDENKGEITKAKSLKEAIKKTNEESIVYYWCMQSITECSNYTRPELTVDTPIAPTPNFRPGVQFGNSAVHIFAGESYQDTKLFNYIDITNLNRIKNSIKEVLYNYLRKSVQHNTKTK